MIIDEHKTIFIHIPKNAGTSIQEYFGNRSFKLQHNKKHDTIHEIRSSFPNLYESHRKFAIIRNPYERMVSWYFYYNVPSFIEQVRKIPFVKSHYDELGCDVNNLSFSNWVKNPKASGIFFDDKSLLNPQHTWIDDTVEIIKFENLNKEINEFFGEEIDLPVANKSDHEHYLTYYDRESLDMVYNKYKEDFEKFDYKKL